MIVGVSGSSGSGKTFIVNFIKKNLPENTVSIMFQDNYYKLREDQSKDENGNYNFDLPSSFNNNDFINDIRPAGRPAGAHLGQRCVGLIFFAPYGTTGVVNF